MNLRARAREDARVLNIRDWSGLAILKGPGVTLKTDAITGEPLKFIQALNNKTSFTPEMGEDMIDTDPVVVFSRDSLAQIPQAGETWYLQIQFEPGGPLVEKLMTPNRAPEGGESLGIIRMYLQDVEQLP